MRTQTEDGVDIFGALQGKLQSLPRSQKLLARFLLTHFEEAVFLNAARLAQRSRTSEATVTRLARALGYRGFPQFQDSMHALIRQKLAPADRMQRVRGIPRDTEAVWDRTFERAFANLRETRKVVSSSLLEVAGKAILAADRKYVVGLRGSAGAALWFGHLLGLILPDVWALTEGGPVLFESLAALGKNDALLAISFPRYTRWTVEALRFAREREAATIVITDSHLSPGAQAADIALVARVDSITFANSYVTPMVLVDALIAILLSLAPDALLARLQVVEQALKGHEFFYQRRDIQPSSINPSSVDVE